MSSCTGMIWRCQLHCELVLNPSSARLPAKPDARDKFYEQCVANSTRSWIRLPMTSGIVKRSVQHLGGLANQSGEALGGCVEVKCGSRPAVELVLDAFEVGLGVAG